MSPATSGDEPFDPRPADPCEEAASISLLATSGEAGPEEARRLEGHLAGCAACREETAAMRGEGEGITLALREAAGSVPRDLAPAVLDRIRREGTAAPPRPGRLARLPRAWIAGLAAAAAVLVVVATAGPVLSGRWWWPAREESKAPTAPPPAARFARLVDVTAASGIDFRHHGPVSGIRWMSEAVGSGVAAADLDGDGRPDLFFGDAWPLDGPRPAGSGNRLYRNLGEGRFADATPGSGVDTPEPVCGVLAADLDGDGRPDLVLCGYGRVRVLANRGGMRFEDVSEAAGFPAEPTSWFTCAAAADLDRDGRLDLFVTRYANQEDYRTLSLRLGKDAGRECNWRGLPVFCGPEPLVPQADRLYRGLGGFRFEDVTASALRGQEARYAFQPIVTDADGDGLLDVYVANDTQANTLWRNLGGMRFEDVALEAGCAFDADGKAQAGMGVAAGDQDGDGVPDLLVVTNFSNDHVTLYRGRGRPGRPSFEDRSSQTGIGAATYHVLGWGVVYADVDQDGTEDLLFANGHLYPNVGDAPGLGVTYAQRMMLFAGDPEGNFADRTDEGGPGLSSPRVHRGLAVADLDGDGRLDFVATTAGGPPVVLRNATPQDRRAWVGFRLRGTRSSRDAAGARVSITAGGRMRTRELHLGDSFASCSEPVLHFGLGEADHVERVVVRWPSGLVEEVPPLPVNRVHDLVEGAPR